MSDRHRDDPSEHEPGMENAALEEARAENRRLLLAFKKLERKNRLLQAQIDRSQSISAAKDSLSRVITAKRTELERYMNLLLTNCPDMILLFDSEDRIAYCTDSFLKACGIASMGIIRGQCYNEIFETYASNDLNDTLVRAFDRLNDTTPVVEYVDLIDFGHQGQPRYYSIQLTYMRDDNYGSSGTMVIFSDKTAIHQAQMEAVRANAAKSDFLATVSHEIRTPMNAIIGVSTMLKSTPLDDKQHGYLQQIQDSSYVLLNLINDILDFSRIEAGKLELVEDYFLTGDLLGHLQSMFEMMFVDKSLAFTCQFSPDLPLVLYGDDSRLRQVLTNLLNNALKYTPEGSVLFKAYPAADGQMVFQVSDTGIGIHPDAIPRLFHEFERLDALRNRSITGTGLGLAISNRLCQLMGGTISVESEYGKGSTFTVTLPLRTGQYSDLPPQTRKESIRFAAPTVRALVADDIEINIQITAYMLDGYQIRIDSAENGRMAAEMAEKTPYDIILMDHMMPEMDGVASTQRIRASHGPNRDTPIIALTANAVSGAAESFLANGMNGFLSKPIDEAALNQCLLQWLPESKIQRID